MKVDLDAACKEGRRLELVPGLDEAVETPALNLLRLRPLQPIERRTIHGVPAERKRATTAPKARNGPNGIAA